ncbi:hypothetical protein [Lysobacter claricitrinus]|uniref:hypothetical protein n=1 Tax=Lysobacter claricitrinus TaxID=3367728 RepID=UPI0037DB7645
MTATTPLRMLLTALLLIGAVAVLTLAATLARHVAGGSHAGLWLFAWSAGFAVLLPVLVTAAAVVAPVVRRHASRMVVPNTGWKIPGAGQ